MMSISCSCAGTGSENDSGNSKDNVFEVAKDADGNDVYIVENGASDYRIVVPDETNKYEELAASDLQLFIQKATGAILPIVKVSSVDSSQGKYIFIGRASGKEAVVTFADYGANGAFIDVENENVYLTGAKGYGITNSVYQFLKYEINWKIYAYDEIYFEPTAKLALLDFQEFKYKPYYNYSVWRAHYSYGYDNAINAARMGQLQATNRGGSTLEGPLYSAWLSNLDDIIPVALANTFMMEIHGDELNVLTEERLASLNVSDDEKDTVRREIEEQIIEEKGWSWYGNGQLCLSKSEVRDKLTEEVKKLLINEPNAEYLQLGGYDEQGACTCIWCEEKLKSCLTQGGIAIDMLNEISKNLEDEGFFEQHPEVNKDVKLTFLNYLSYEGAPVDDEGNVYVKARDNVGVFWCPIGACYSHSLDDPNCNLNKKEYKNLVGWSKVTKYLGVYVYGCNYRNYFTQFNNWGHFRTWAKKYEEFSLDYINYHAVVQFDYAPLDRLRHYLYNVYVDDPNIADYDTVVQDFMNQYYKVAAKDMMDYYEAVRRQNTVLTFETEYSCSKCFDDGNIGAHYTDKQWWPWETLNNLLDYIYKAYDSIDNSNLSVEDKTMLKERILIEEVTIRYWKFTYYPGYYTQGESTAERQYLYDMAEKLNITEMVI